VGVIQYFSGLNISIKTVSCSTPETIDIQSSQAAVGVAKPLSDLVVCEFTGISRRDLSKHF
jgi:hypothetical protein